MIFREGNSLCFYLDKLIESRYFFMLAISYLSQVYLAQYGQYFPRFSYFVFISLA